MKVLGSVQYPIVGSASGVSLDVSAYHLIRFEGGQVRRYRMFTTREDALEAAERG